jgi:hypothetical protein
MDAHELWHGERRSETRLSACYQFKMTHYRPAALEWQFQGQVPPGFRLLRTIPYPNILCAHPSTAASASLGSAPCPHKSRRPARLAGRMVSKEPLNSNCISLSLWGFFAIQRSAAFSVPHRSGSPGAPGEWTRWLGRANAVSWHPRQEATATDQGQRQCSPRTFFSA